MSITPTSDELDEDIKKELFEKITTEFHSKPPVIGVIGVSGVGKSATLNSIFHLGLKESPTIRGTTTIEKRDIEAKVQRGVQKGRKARITVIDAPGLGEDVAKDPEYLKMYNDNLGSCDVIVWIMTARNRAVALDQIYLNELSAYFDRMIFAINQVDLVDPIDWNERHNLPSDEQKKNIGEIIADRKSRIESVVSKPIDIIAYSAKRYYRLISLYDLINAKIPVDRRWMFEAFRATTAKDWLDRTKLWPWEKWQLMRQVERQQRGN